MFSSVVVCKDWGEDTSLLRGPTSLGKKKKTREADAGKTKEVADLSGRKPTATMDLEEVRGYERTTRRSKKGPST